MDKWNGIRPNFGLLLSTFTYFPTLFVTNKLLVRIYWRKSFPSNKVGQTSRIQTGHVKPTNTNFNASPRIGQLSPEKAKQEEEEVSRPISNFRWPIPSLLSKYMHLPFFNCYMIRIHWLRSQPTFTQAITCYSMNFPILLAPVRVQIPLPNSTLVRMARNEIKWTWNVGQ